MERVKGFEPSTFAMATRRSSQLSYTRTLRKHYPDRTGDVYLGHRSSRRQGIIGRVAHFVSE